MCGTWPLAKFTGVGLVEVCLSLGETWGAYDRAEQAVSGRPGNFGVPGGFSGLLGLPSLQRLALGGKRFAAKA